MEEYASNPNNFITPKKEIYIGSEFTSDNKINSLENFFTPLRIPGSAKHDSFEKSNNKFPNFYRSLSV